MYDGKPKCARSPVDSVRAVPTVFEGQDHDDKKDLWLRSALPLKVKGSLSDEQPRLADASILPL
jgi:hypothetical protein